MVSTTAAGNGKGNKRSVKRPKLKYFYVNDKLHKKLHIDRARDVLTAWNYPDGGIVKYNYTDVLHTHGKAFSTQEVGRLLNRHRVTLEKAIMYGYIAEPQHTYGINENRQKYQYFWSEKDVMDAHEYFASLHRGRPRKDGLVTSAFDLPTPRELRALMRGEEVLYVKQGDQFVPTFRAKVWE